MLNTVKYNLYRLLKSKLVFGLMLAGIVVGCVGTAIMQHFGSGMFDFSIIIITCVLPTVIYPDYRDGLIRNKTMAGNSRAGIYGANMISNSIIGVAYWFVYQALVIGLMNILPGTAMLTGTHAVIYLAVGTLAIVSLCSIYTLIAVLVRSHFSLIICIVAYIAMTMLCGSFMNLTANPSMSAGVRKMILVIYRIIPAGQFTLLETAMFTHIWLLPLLSVAVIAVMTFIGTTIFKKKDLK